jgi:hypothetical protein
MSRRIVPPPLAPPRWRCGVDGGRAPGAAVGLVAVLEARGRSDYLRAVRTMQEAVPLRPGGRILAEMVRVTRPGGHVAVLVWGNDRPSLVNLEGGSALEAKVEAPMGLHVLAQGGCADASLYRRMRDAGPTLRRLFPGLVAFTGPMGYCYLDGLEAGLSGEGRHEWRTAMTQAETAGTLFMAQPFHCAVGMKPSGASRRLQGEAAAVCSARAAPNNGMQAGLQLPLRCGFWPQPDAGLDTLANISATAIAGEAGLLFARTPCRASPCTP